MSSEVISPGRSTKVVGEVLHSLIIFFTMSRKSRPSWIKKDMLKMSMVLFHLVISSWSTQSCPCPSRCCRKDPDLLSVLVVEDTRA